MSNKVFDLIFKQHNIGSWWGGFINTVSNASMIITLYNTAMITPVAYVTWVQPFASNLDFNLSFGLFLLIIIVGGITVLLIQYKFLTASSFTFWADQFWMHGENPISKKQEEQDKRLDDIESKLDKLLEMKK